MLCKSNDKDVTHKPKPPEYNVWWFICLSLQILQISFSKHSSDKYTFQHKLQLGQNLMKICKVINCSRFNLDGKQMLELNDELDL